MDAGFTMEQISTLFFLVGALQGGLGGWVVPQGCPPQKVNVPSNNKIRRLLMYASVFIHDNIT